MRSHPGKTTTIYDIPGVVNTAYMSAMTHNNILSGFRSTGIHPYNADIFPRDEFAPSSVTDRPNLDRPVPDDQRPPVASTSASADDQRHPVASTSASADNQRSPVPSSSASASHDNLMPSATPRDTQSCSWKTGYVSPSDILPFPKATPRKTQGKRKRGKTTILTNTPETAMNREAAREREKKNKEKEERAVKKQQRKHSKVAPKAGKY